MQKVPVGRYLLFFTLAAGGCAVDLATKSWIFGLLGMPGTKPAKWLWPEIFGLETWLNEGALFGMGQGQTTLFAGLSVVAAIGVLYWLFIAGAARDRLLTVALGMITGGIFGNLYDRLGLHGLRWHSPATGHEVGERVYAVRDWLHFKVDAWNFDWPIFNIADSLLVCGGALLILHALCEAKPQKPSSEAAPES